MRIEYELGDANRVYSGIDLQKECGCHLIIAKKSFFKLLRVSPISSYGTFHKIACLACMSLFFLEISHMHTLQNNACAER